LDKGKKEVEEVTVQLVIILCFDNNLIAKYVSIEVRFKFAIGINNVCIKVSLFKEDQKNVNVFDTTNLHSTSKLAFLGKKLIFRQVPTAK
jgi:hypothetical protein